jgi:beta-lactamase class A
MERRDEIHGRRMFVMRLLRRPGASVLTSMLVLATLAPAASAQETSRIDGLVAVVQPLVEAAAKQGIRVSVGLADLAVPGGQSAVVGSRESYNPASTIKLALLATLLRQVDRGYMSLEAPITISPYMVVGGAGTLQNETMPYTTTVADVARRMIIVSDNTATNVLLYSVGIPTVQALLSELGLETMKFNRQMFPGDRISDPANVIDAADTIELLRAMYEGNLLSEASRAQVLEWLLEQKVKTKFGAVLDGRPVAHKTGETSNFTHDVGYFLVPGRETIVAVFTEVTTTTEYAEAARVGNPIIQQIALAIYRHLESRDGLAPLRSSAERVRGALQPNANTRPHLLRSSAS